ncbi:MAG: Txe/YoeB family addiction module toxin [Deltaproteobacteria bacterium]|jgi:toxin YoeB|nr:Txe/YoeB family addiction module toxin [Deltaproteobacteria bacterium]
MNKVWSDDAWEDYLHWEGQDRKTLGRINGLLKDIGRNGHEGIGKPEPLKHGLAGYWSRRIDDVNRQVYIIENEQIEMIQCRTHCDD